MQRRVPALVIATTLLALHKINTQICIEGSWNILWANKAFLFVFIANALPIPSILRCLCVHFLELEIHCEEKRVMDTMPAKNKKEIKPRIEMRGSREITH